jgi:hypothetical protein
MRCAIVSLIVMLAPSLMRAQEKSAPPEVLADPPREVKETSGLHRGDRAPFLVVDLVAGPFTLSGCPFVMVANSQLPGVIILARGDANLATAVEIGKALEGRPLNLTKRNSFIVAFRSDRRRIAAAAKDAELAKFSIGVPRAPQKETLERLGMAAKDGLMVLHIDGKQIKNVWTVADGKVSKQDRGKLIAEIEKNLGTEELHAPKEYVPPKE